MSSVRVSKKTYTEEIASIILGEEDENEKNPGLFLLCNSGDKYKLTLRVPGKGPHPSNSVDMWEDDVRVLINALSQWLQHKNIRDIKLLDKKN